MSISHLIHALPTKRHLIWIFQRCDFRPNAHAAFNETKIFIKTLQERCENWACISFFNGHKQSFIKRCKIFCEYARKILQNERQVGTIKKLLVDIKRKWERKLPTGVPIISSFLTRLCVLQLTWTRSIVVKGDFHPTHRKLLARIKLISRECAKLLKTEMSLN
jgi:hypothetical protein